MAGYNAEERATDYNRVLTWVKGLGIDPKLPRGTLASQLKRGEAYRAARLVADVKKSKTQVTLSSVAKGIADLLQLRLHPQEEASVIAFFEDEQPHVDHVLRAYATSLDDVFAASVDRSWFSVDVGQPGIPKDSIAYKAYFTLVPRERTAEKVRDQVLTIYQAFIQAAKALDGYGLDSGELIGLKVATYLWQFFSWNDTFVVHYESRKSGPKIQKLVTEILAKNGLEARGRPSYRTDFGFDFADMRRYGARGSHRQLISEVAAYDVLPWLLTAEEPSPDLVRKKLTDAAKLAGTYTPKRLERRLKAIPDSFSCEGIPVARRSQEQLAKEIVKSVNFDNILKEIFKKK